MNYPPRICFKRIMSSKLERDFYQSIQQFDYLCQFLGIHLHHQSSTSWLSKMVTVVWLTINIQSAGYLFVNRAIRDLKESFQSINSTMKMSSSKQMDTFNGFVLNSSPIIFFCSSHVYLIICGKETMCTVLNRLSAIFIPHRQESNANWLKEMRMISLAAVTWIILTVITCFDQKWFILIICEMIFLSSVIICFTNS